MARPPSRAERQSRSPGKPRPIRVATKRGACFLICQLRLLGIVVQATTFVARLAFIRIFARNAIRVGLVQRFPSLSGLLERTQLCDKVVGVAAIERLR